MEIGTVSLPYWVREVREDRPEALGQSGKEPPMVQEQLISAIEKSNLGTSKWDGGLMCLLSLSGDNWHRGQV